MNIKKTCTVCPYSIFKSIGFLMLLISLILSIIVFINLNYKYN